MAETRVLTDYDRYCLDRRPLPVALVRLSDRDATRLYIDPGTAKLVGAYSARNWVTRWLYHGLHSLDFPWLYRYRPLWDVVVGAFAADAQPPARVRRCARLRQGYGGQAVDCWRLMVARRWHGESLRAVKPTCPRGISLDCLSVDS